VCRSLPWLLLRGAVRLSRTDAHPRPALRARPADAVLPSICMGVFQSAPVSRCPPPARASERESAPSRDGGRPRPWTARPLGCTFDAVADVCQLNACVVTPCNQSAPETRSSVGCDLARKPRVFSEVAGVDARRETRHEFGSSSSDIHPTRSAGPRTRFGPGDASSPRDRAKGAAMRQTRRQTYGPNRPADAPRVRPPFACARPSPSDGTEGGRRVRG
jgi:hypothetical protein